MDKVTSYIKECETEFMQLLGLTCFPAYEIAYKEISLSFSDEQGYDSLGSAHYDYRTGKHTLIVWSNIHTLGEVGKQTIFHEFTHILDDETYVSKDPEKYIANHGYTEYHAAQIGFLKVLGVKSTTVPATVLKPDKITSYAPLPVKRGRKSATLTSSVPWYWKKAHSNT